MLLSPRSRRLFPADEIIAFCRKHLAHFKAPRTPITDATRVSVATAAPPFARNAMTAASHGPGRERPAATRRAGQARPAPPAHKARVAAEGCHDIGCSV
jgi:hypothetical protein